MNAESAVLLVFAFYIWLAAIGLSMVAAQLSSMQQSARDPVNYSVVGQMRMLQGMGVSP